jgi:hypothetical protein
METIAIVVGVVGALAYLAAAILRPHTHKAPPGR